MRIAINAAFLGGGFDGLSTYTRSVVDELSGSESEVFVYTSEPNSLNGNGRAKWRPTPAAIRAERGLSGNALRTLVWSQTGLPARLLRDRAQVLLSTLPEGMLAPVCPQVVVVHDLFPLFFPALYPRWRHYFRHVLPRVLRASDSVIAVSNHTKQDLVRHLGLPEKRISVVYNWIDPLFFSDEPGVPPEGYEAGPYFLFVGRSTAYKNLGMVVRALATIREDVKHDLACVLGFTSELDRRHYAQVLELASRLGVRQRLRVYTGLQPRQLLFLYRQATALVLLSKYEGFGYPPLEAMAAGTPAIVSNSTSLGEVAGPAAVSVANDVPGPAAEAMKKLAGDRAYRARLAEEGKVHAGNFSRERSGRLIRLILERHARS